MMPTKKPSVTYEVKAVDGRWIVLRNGLPTGGFGSTLHMAVNGAVGEAKQEARSAELKVKVVSVVDAARTTEWESP